MKRQKLITLLTAVVLSGPIANVAGAWPDQVRSGEAGYKIGCSMVNTGGVQACGEMPSYQSMRRQQEQERARRAAEQERRAREDRLMRYRHSTGAR